MCFNKSFINKRIILLFLLIFLLSLSVISANENNDTDNLVQLDDNSDLIAINGENSISKSLENANDDLKSDSDIHNFTELSNELNSGSNEIKLNYKYYKYVNGEVGCSIGSSVSVIDGGGAIIDGSNLIQILKVSNNNKLILKNINFIDGVVTGNVGGAINFNTVSNTILLNCNFSHFSGKALRFDGVTDNITFIDCDFEGCTDSYFGGAILFNGATTNIHFNQCDFSNNVVTSNTGGDVAFRSVTGVSFNECTFKDSRASSNGGAICVYTSANDVVVTSCNFTNCHAGGTGGAISFQRQTGSVNNIIIRDCNFTDCRASGHSGSIHINAASSNGNCEISDCNFINSYSGSSGGAINVRGGHDFNIKNCNFYNCTGSYNGGAIELYSRDSCVENCNFTNNTITGTVGNNPTGIGGAIVLYSGANNVTIAHCNFINNSATDPHRSGVSTSNSIAGGAIGSANNNCLYTNITDCTFIGNSAPHGGAIYYFSSNTTINNCEFYNNTASLEGGAVYANAANSMVIHSTFKDNNATNGLNFYATTGNNIKFIDCGFTEVFVSNDHDTSGDGLRYDNPCDWNTALDMVERGGTVYLVGCITNFTDHNINKKITVKAYDSTSVVNLDGLNCRAFTVTANDTIISGITFKNSIISDNGGVFRWLADGGTVINCIFDNNHGVNGSCIYLESGDVFIVENCTFTNNIADYGGAVFISNCTNQSFVLNSVFQSNTAYLGGAVYIDDNIYYYVDNSTRSNFKNNKYTSQIVVGDYDDIYDKGAYQTRSIVYVVRYPNVNATGDIDNPTSFVEGFNMVSPNGIIIFCNSSEVYDYGVHLNRVCAKTNVTFLGNDTHFVNISFIVNRYAKEFKIYDFVFKGNSESTIIWEATGGEIVNCNFTDNGGSDGLNGTCIRVGGDNLKVKNCIFINNNALSVGSCGGALWVNANDILIENCSFVNNSAYDCGSHIYFGNLTFNVYIVNSSFINGSESSFGNGSGIVVLGDNINFISCSFFNNSGVNGSAIYVDSNVVSIVDSFFASPKFDEINNLIEGYVYSTNNITLKNNTLSFTDLNHVVSDADSNLTLQYNYKYFEDYDEPFTNGVSINKTLTIEGNNHILDGDNKARVFVVSASDVKISNVCFVNASRDLHVSGGAILWNGDNGVLFNSSFKNCIAISSSTSYLNGGAIYLTGANANITFCTFDSCVANHAASIWIKGQNSYISDCVFTNNYADQYDATIWFDSNSNGFVLRNSIFKDNNASRWAGALRIQTNGEVIGCIFDNNLVKKSNKTQSGADDRFGGSIYLTVDDVIIKDCTFSNNCLIEGVSMKGGAIYSKNIFVLTNCTFINNSALMGSAIYYDGSSVLSIDDCVFAVGKYDEENNKLPGYIFTNGNVIFNNVTLSFTDLSYLINNTDNIDLQFNYLYFNNYDQAFINGVPIKKVLTINGNDKVIDGNFTARIFNVSSMVVLNNLNLINGNASLGGAIYSTGDLTLTNVTFANNTAVNGSAIYVIKTINHWDNITFKDNDASNATVYFDGDSTLYSNNLSFINNQVPKLNIVGTDHIYSSIIYVSNNHIGFGIITEEATSLTHAVDNILPNGKIIILDDYDVESIIKFTNLNNITVVGNKTKLKDKYLFIIPIIQKYIKKKQIVF